MGSAILLDEALELLRNLGFEVRQEHLDGQGGGLCRIDRRQSLFIDLDTSLESQLDSCIDALRTHTDIESIFVSPALRERLQR